MNKGPRAMVTAAKVCNERSLLAVRMKILTVSKNEHRGGHGKENTAMDVEIFRQLR